VGWDGGWGATSGRAGGEDAPWPHGMRLLERFPHGDHAWTTPGRAEGGVGGVLRVSARRFRTWKFRPTLRLEVASYLAP
jgi:hypothetical protein